MTDPHCYLESLSPELLIPILTRLPDLESLDSLLRASPAAYHVFDTHAATVFEEVLSSGSTHTYTCALIRIIALIRAEALPPTVHDLASFKDLVRHETSPHRWKPPRWVHPPTSLPLDLSSAVLRGLLATNRKVQRLTFGCLDYYLDRFRPLKPFNSAGFSFNSTYFGEHSRGLIGAWNNKQPNTVYYYPVHDIGPPSWVEQQRVLRAFWRIQLSRDLSAAVGASHIIWLEGETFKGNYQMSPADLCDVPQRFTDAAGGVLLGGRELRSRETLLEHELLESAIQYMQEVKEVTNESTYWRLKKDWAAGSAPANQKDLETLDLTFRSNMWSYFSNLSGDPWYHDMSFLSPLQHVKFESFRRFGFAIWSTARMAEYGLLMADDDAAAGLQQPNWEAWRNLLTQDERDEVDRENKRRDG
ncbi:hypothetical protein N431DRAFT_164954 [Stipitochalara longipes BDJ]|nr:hypothetical protein N431DRAFT_164954 [Stipitochalara longipes BDJ]